MPCMLCNVRTLHRTCASRHVDTTQKSVSTLVPVPPHPCREALHSIRCAVSYQMRMWCQTQAQQAKAVAESSKRQQPLTEVTVKFDSASSAVLSLSLRCCAHILARCASGKSAESDEQAQVGCSSYEPA